MVKEKNYKREITHTKYTYMSKAAENVGILNKLNKEITDNKWITKKSELDHKKTFKHIDDKVIEFEVAPKVIPLIWGGYLLSSLFL